MSESRWTLPNTITAGRIVACPFVAWLALSPGTTARFAAFVLFLAAALSDLWDGWLARKYDWVTDVGKLLDPLADKLLLVATFIPFYIVSQRPGEANDVPFWGPLPLWILVVIFGRELFMTVFRQWAQGRGTVIAAGKSGKYKSLVQNLFAGGLLLWYAMFQWAGDAGHVGGVAWSAWAWVHRSWVGVTLAIALVLTVYSMMDYLWRYRTLLDRR